MTANAPPTLDPREAATIVAGFDSDQRRHFEAAERMLRMSRLTDEQIDADLGLSYVDLVALDEESAPPVTVPGLLVAGQAHWYMGHPESGKSTLALHAAHEVMKLGLHVVWIDWEMGARQAKRRARAVGVSDDLLSDQFHYTAFPAEFNTGAGTARLLHDLERWPGSLVVLDSCSKALSAAGLDENSPTDATKWTTSVVLPLREAGATLLVIDHVSKSATRSQPYPRGAGSKLADTDVALFIEATRKFSRARSGELAVTKQKDREGVLPDGTQRYSIGDGQGGLPIERLDDESDPSDARDDARCRARAEVGALLRRHDGDELTTNQVCQLINAKREYVRQSLAELAADAAEPYTARPGPNNSVRYSFDASAATGIAL